MEIGQIIELLGTMETPAPARAIVTTVAFCSTQKKVSRQVRRYQYTIWRNRFVKVHEPSARLTRMLRQRSHN
jgi:hypothetical protein